jgi:hypothetical protein
MTNFPGKEKILFWQERKRLKQEIRRVILAAMTLAKNPKDRVTIEKFLDVIDPGTLYDYARWPYRANRYGNAYSATKIHCVFALIANLISAYWTYIGNENPEDIGPCEAAISKLQTVCDAYNILTVHGDLVKGYWLK